MRKTVVLYPGFVVSHFIAMIQLADAFLEHGYAVAVALIDSDMKENTALAAVVGRLAATRPSVSFHTLPPPKYPPAYDHDAEFLLKYFDVVSRYNQHLDDFLCSMDPRRIHAVVVDSLSVEAFAVTKKLGIPAYTFFSSNATALAVFLQLPSIRAEGEASFKEMGNTPLELFGLPTMPASHLLGELLEDPESEIYKKTMASIHGIPESNGILTNTCASLEPRAVGALSNPRCLPGRVLPPVYCVGPIVGAAGGEDREAKERQHRCLAWLDGQPDRSVVFLCFGSIAQIVHSEEQLKEIAVGIERSGHRFLWVVRAPLNDDTEKPFDPPRSEPDLDELLPEGFLERTNGRGLVVKQWAPQVDVLRHRATGAFVTHCGWNSVLEGITAGVPMLCWPMYGEQKINKVLMVEEMKMAVEMAGWQDGLVKANEVESKVRLVMESEEGKEMRARVVAHKEVADMVWKDDGLSRAAFTCFLSDAEIKTGQSL